MLQLLKFGIVGVANTAVCLIVIYGSMWVLDFDELLSNLLGYIIGLGVSFLLNSRWTFQHSGSKLIAAVKFLGVFIAAYLTNLACVFCALYLWEVEPDYAQLAGIIPYTFVFYFGSKLIAFRETPDH